MELTRTAIAATINKETDVIRAKPTVVVDAAKHAELGDFYWLYNFGAMRCDGKQLD